MLSTASKHIRKATLSDEWRGARRQSTNLAKTVRSQREKKGDSSVSIQNFKFQFPTRGRTAPHEERLTIKEALLPEKGTEAQVHEFSCSQIPGVPHVCERDSPTATSDH